MGDRTYVELSVPLALKEKAKALINFTTDEEYQHEEVYVLVFGETNYGNLPFLGKLMDAGIAYDSSWGRGDEYGPGTEYLRFLPDGSVNSWTAYENDANPNIGKLLALIDKPEELRHYILDHEKSQAIPPWDNQEEYGKIYMARKLIS